MFGRKKKKKKEEPVLHRVSLWRYDGTGRADDKEGWQCTCGVWGWPWDGSVNHMSQVAYLNKINRRGVL